MPTASLTSKGQNHDPDRITLTTASSTRRSAWLLGGRGLRSLSDTAQTQSDRPFRRAARVGGAAVGWRHGHGHRRRRHRSRFTMIGLDASAGREATATFDRRASRLPGIRAIQ